MRKFYAASGQGQGSTVATFVLGSIEEKNFKKQKKIFAHVFWVPDIWVLPPA